MTPRTRGERKMGAENNDAIETSRARESRTAVSGLKIGSTYPAPRRKPPLTGASKWHKYAARKDPNEKSVQNRQGCDFFNCDDSS